MQSKDVAQKKNKKDAPDALTDAGAAPGDALLACLVYLSRHYGRARSADAITAGLACDADGMGPALFCEAAENMGLSAKIVRRSSLRAISSSVLPCVLVLQSGQACVLLQLSKSGKAAKIYVPETESVRDLPVDRLKRDYTGYAIFTHPKAAFVHPETAEADDVANHWFWGPVRENMSIYAMVLLASLFINLFVLVSPLFVMNVYDRVIPNNAIETGWALGIGALVAFVFDFVFRTVRGYLIDFAGRKTDVIAARRIYDQVLNMKLSQRAESSGAFASMLRDFDAVREFFTSATITVLVDLPFSLFFLYFVYRLGGSVALILVALIGVVCIVGYLVQFRLKRLVRKSIKSSEAKHALLVETIQGLEAIKAVAGDGRFRARYGQYVGDNAATSQKSRFWSALGVNIATFLQQSASVIIILTGMYLVQEGDLTMGGLIACVILGGRAIAPIGQIANLMTRYHQAGGALKTLNGIMAREVERPAGKAFLHRPDLMGKIAFEKVSFAYPGTKNAVLDSVSFAIEPGEKVGIIGRIGSGKSTVLKLLMKLYEPQDGTVLIDDTDYRQIDPADLRRHMGYIAQDVVLFRGSVRDNIMAGHIHAGEEEILAAAKACGVHDFIARHPMGYDAPVGEGGSGLSGGQRQAIAMARAMLSKPGILLCDEPTNAMDMQAEQVFCDYIQEHIEGKTFVLVTHKHNMLSLVDRLILMHEGKVIMDGPREKVVAALQSGLIQAPKDEGGA